MPDNIPMVPDQSFSENVHAEPAEPFGRIKELTVDELIALELPPREHIIYPILPSKGLMMVHAARGTGKTFFVISLALAIATASSFLDWKVPKARNVLIVDGEMATEDLKNRFASIIKGASVEILSLKNFSLIAADHQENGLPDLATKDGFKAFKQYFEKFDVIIFDNISTLFPSLRENENDDAMSIIEILLYLRRRGKSAVLVHHSGKSGQQRGGSRKEDLLNTVIALKRPDDVDDSEGCVFDVKFEKARGFFGNDAEPFRAKLIQTGDGGLAWQRQNLEAKLADDILELHKQGLTQRKIATELNVNLTKVNRVLKKAKQGEDRAAA